MPFDPENPFVTADPSEWLRIRALPHIIVHPKARSFSPRAIRAFTPVFDGLWRRSG
jgi:hypothetical protein